MTVAASPYNGVKLELGILLCLGVLVWLMQGRVSASIAIQYAMLAGYGLAAALWLALRTHRVTRRLLAQAPPNPPGASEA